VQAELASEVLKNPDADLQNCATIRFLTEYAAIDGFAEQFEKVLNGEMEEAILKGGPGEDCGPAGRARYFH
jgi:hypothetical protein